MSETPTPTLYEWLGGQAVLDRLTTRFYERVKDDAILAPVFAHMSGDHPHHVALFLAEVLGGPTTYSEQHGGHAHMVSRHLSRHLSQVQRRAWVALLLDTADELGIPDDPEFRSAIVGYLEWGSRLGRDQLGVGRERDRAGHADAEVGLGRGQGPVPGLTRRRLRSSRLSVPRRGSRTGTTTPSGR